MISKEILYAQVKRLFLLPFAPNIREDIAGMLEEYKRQVARCYGDAHLVAVIDHAMDTMTRFPAPAELRQLIDATPDPEWQEGPAGCEQCRESDGWAHSLNGTGMSRCNCARGKWLREKERVMRARDIASGKIERRLLI